MKTLEQIFTHKSECIDGRDLTRLAAFVTADQLEKLGFALKEGATHKPVQFTRKNVLRRLKNDLAFGFEKALNQRGISASLMYEVVKMWMWVLDDPLADWDDEDYAQYGLRFFKAVALKYNFDNPIGDKNGDEPEFSCEFYQDN